MALMIPERVKERAASRYVVDERGCWISIYSVSTHGYAQIGWQDGKPGSHKMVLAHRAAFEFHSGERIPDQMTVDHTCHSPRCVNPDHMRLLTMSDNSKRNRSDRSFPVGWFCSQNHDPSMARKRKRNMSNGRVKITTICGQCDRDANTRYREKVRSK